MWAAQLSTGAPDAAVRALAWLAQRRAGVARLIRYGATSVVAFGVSEVTLLVLYGTGLLGATVAALAANLAGTVPSYLMSRYWIWKEAPRKRAGRQIVRYWTISAVCIALTSLATGAIARLVPAGHPFHLAIVAIGFLVVSTFFWLAKYVVYERTIFPTPESQSTPRPAAFVAPVGSHVGEPSSRRALDANARYHGSGEALR